MLKTITETFDEEIKHGRKAILFTASWCDTCHKLVDKIKPIHHCITQDIIQVDVDDHDDIADQYNIKSLPVVLIVEDGVVVDRFENNTPFVDIINAIRNIK